MEYDIYLIKSAEMFCMHFCIFTLCGIHFKNFTRPFILSRLELILRSKIRKQSSKIKKEKELRTEITLKNTFLKYSVLDLNFSYHISSHPVPHYSTKGKNVHISSFLYLFISSSFFFFKPCPAFILVRSVRIERQENMFVYLFPGLVPYTHITLCLIPVSKNIDAVSEKLHV